MLVASRAPLRTRLRPEGYAFNSSPREKRSVNEAYCTPRYCVTPEALLIPLMGPRVGCCNTVMWSDMLNWCKVEVDELDQLPSDIYERLLAFDS